MLELDNLQNTTRTEDNLVKDVCEVLVGLEQEDMAEGLVELVAGLDRGIQTRDLEIEELMSAIDELQNELGNELDRIDFLENELARAERELEDGNNKL